MDLPPFVARGRELAGQRPFDTAYFKSAESVALTQFRWSMWTIQDEYSLAVRSYYVEMRGPMIGRIDDHTQAIETESGGHIQTSTNLSG
jgi:hypothetical protein